MILLSSLNNIINSNYLSTFDRIVAYGSLGFYFGIFSYIIYLVYIYRIEVTLVQSNLQKFFLVESLEAHLSRRIYWVLFELRKLFCCLFVVIYNKQVISIWVSITISFVFILFLTLYRPFSSKLELGFLVSLEIIFFSSQIVLVFMSQLDSIQSNFLIYFELNIYLNFNQKTLFQSLQCFFYLVMSLVSFQQQEKFTKQYNKKRLNMKFNHSINLTSQNKKKCLI
ncbi:transmembrane protein, putative (macronuclear) [Tetrahymena thermophila SB210]|uniref:Transmembrane protein, putative n=1 Tax=Tetrahymena thermophila (strain SB210) TaxID=312017 RepID=W7XFQ7_TETTS|nr:transmembrane protein, putative [Tetrahymena thermophila SB210]EWS75693.1 transmembrane protein, putative [Tetrahymena thermophila SB210]|eukprot:XP_012651766.1 transmembrane protein, putative [Tetrahymena thermophila SB210]